ncbi:uracil-DNA glycosylase family protein [Flavobacterium mekongense]|uniref:uracil-DNA glycosylase family protein n=1 Tax=Flavobacterium mekongense TaxID=3379707 RepID=UPI003999B3A0
MNLACDKCIKFGLGFYSVHIQPHEYIEGKRNADIWIIGLNPKAEIGNVEKRTLSDFENFDPDCHPYFHDFKKVSSLLYKNWKDKNSRIAHTDLVKCFSLSFPPKLIENNKLVKSDLIIENCLTHLNLQLKSSKPKLIICNGTAVCWEMIKLFPPNSGEDLRTITSYKTSIKFENEDEHHFWIVLSGFIGRIDDRNKRRLGKEIENILSLEKITL